MTPTTDDNYWSPGLVETREAIAKAREAMVFLHLAKSGGSSFGESIAQSRLWRSVEFPYPAPAPSETMPQVRQKDLWGRPIMDPWVRVAHTARRKITPMQGIFVWGGHPTFDHVSWLASQLLPADELPQVVTTFRPTRDRIVSRFRDYWSRVALADLPLKVAAKGQRERHTLEFLRRDLAAFKKDSVNYRDESGRIDGRRWFRDVFENPGFPFLLKDVFESPAVISEALESGRLRAIPTANLNSEITQITGERPQILRVSPPIPEAVAAAIEDSRDYLDLMEASDRDYERAFDDFLAKNR